MPKSIEERLNAHPELKTQMLLLLELAESGIERADEVEKRTVENIRGLGRQVIQDWAEQQEKRKSEAAQDAVDAELDRKGKKNSTGPRRSER